MSLSKEEINILKLVLALEERALSRRALRQLITLRQHMLVRNWVLELRSSKNKIQKQTKCGARFANSTFQFQAKYKK
jgi:hypothetical protein